MSLAYLQRGEYTVAEQTALQALANDLSDMYANALLYEYIAKANIGTGNRQKALAAFDLHPYWQRTIIKYLSDLFPQTQFIYLLRTLW